ncbi:MULTISPECIES: UbiD family decarboxylase [Haloferax]|nr:MULTISPECIES: UbiD family decarboxylase [Haloferax]
MRDLREFVAAIEERGQLERVSGADLELEIGGISKIARRDELGTALLFGDFEGTVPGSRVLTNALDTPLQVTLALGHEPTSDIREAVLAQKETASEMKTRPVEVVEDGPVFENVQRGDDVDLTAFPAPRWHENDGGRYIGTGDVVITESPDGDDRNAGTYRVQVHGPKTATLNIRPGRDADRHRQAYFDRDEPFPAVISLGHQPDLFMAANQRFPSHVDEMEYVSAQRDQPLEVVEGEVSGLPIPAHAELVVEGKVWPDAEEITEGPFGEWTGYYGAGETQQRPFEIDRIYYRDDPIVLTYNNVPMTATAMSTIRSGAALWHQLEEAGMTGIDEVTTIFPGIWFQVISIEQQYPGHSTQVGLQAMSLPAGSWEGRITIVVDEDINVYDLDEVLWATVSRCDPAEDMQLIENCVSSRINPRLSAEQEKSGDHTKSRLFFDATKPYHWKEEFPPDTKLDPDMEADLRAEWSDLLSKP